MPFEVTANISGVKGGKRVQTTLEFETRAKAESYARETNRWRKGANARVVHIAPKGRGK